MAVTRPLARTRETTMTAVPRQPRLLWNGRQHRREAEPMPAQTLEMVRPANALHSCDARHGQRGMRRCGALQARPDLVRSATLFHW